MKAKCNHEIGYIQRDRYDCVETDFINLDFYDLETAQNLKSNGGLHNFCPNCGEKLEGVLEARVQEIKKDIQARKEKEEADKLIAQQKFNKEVEEMALKTRLNFLPEGNFLVIFHPFKNNDPRDVVMSGTKEWILKSCVQGSRYDSKRDSMTIKHIYKLPTQEVFLNLLKEQGFEVSASGIGTRTLNNKVQELNYSAEGGTVYVSEYSKSDEDTYKNYSNFGIHRLGEFLKMEYLLETQELIG